MDIREILSIQLYSLRSLPSWENAFEAVAAAGYRYVEMIGSHLADPETTKAQLDAAGLAASSSHVELDQLRNEPAAVIEACRILNFGELYMPIVPLEQRHMDARGWSALGAELGGLAEQFQSAGIRLGYHNHDWELAEKAPGETALDLLFAAAKGSPLVWQADVAWLTRGGADPVAVMRRHNAILRSAHVKDIAAEGSNLDEDGWADVGSGVLDWAELWKSARQAGAKWMVVEHDKPRDPAAFARHSFDYLAALEG